MQLSDVSFPLYRLPAGEPTIDNGVSFYLYGKGVGDPEAEYKVSILDDKNIDGNTLAIRRLKLLAKGVPLYKLGQGIFYLADLIKLCKGQTWFIDKYGKIFSYKKTRRVPLVYKEVKQIIPVKTGGAIVEIHGISTRFKVLHMPIDRPRYAGLLVFENSYILYGLYEEQKRNSFKLI